MHAHVSLHLPHENGHMQTHVFSYPVKIKTYYKKTGQVRVSFGVGEPSSTAPHEIRVQVAPLGTSFRRTYISLETQLCV